MPNERRVDTGDPSPHFDGKLEGPVNDSVGGPTMGIRSDINPDDPMSRNPYHVTKLRDKEMEHLNDVIGGKKVKEEE